MEYEIAMAYEGARMRRTVLGLIVTASVAALLAGCGTEPGPAAPVAPPAQPPAPTAPVGADGQPIRTLCDLLSAQDFAELTGQAGQPPSGTGATSTSATCDYGANRKVVIQVVGSAEAASAAYQSTLKAVTPVKQDAMAGVDESSYGSSAGSGVLNLRRRQLVVSISLPGADNEINLVKLAAVLLSRANALGA